MEDDIKKNWWVIVALVIVVVIGTNVVTPTAKRIQEQNTKITNMTYTAP